ncbi:minor structural protein [Liquorilactobacillus uvarum DSM 19971]|uniref:Minor structural protein n=1 Tax=Liquorilactobacillus uvarum DSM 19971 TaxID=1423812 RepID=A0A0R1Q5S6_9LACO|nr:minor structural protein [Liquorilactobacillus uvarum DSM 19971]
MVPLPNDKLIVQGLNSAYKEPLKSVFFNSFYIQPSLNESWQLQFTAYDDKSIAFNMLDVEASVFWDNQEYIIKQIVPDHADGFTTVQVTCSHVGYEVARIWQHSIKTGTLTYSVDDVLSFILGGNSEGFTWQVIGSFSKDQITDLGNCSGKDMLSKIISTWSDAIFWPDNKNIRIYQHDALVKDLGHRLDYLHNTRELKLTYDSTSGIVNKMRCVSVEKDSSDSNNPTYWFDPFYVTDDASIARYGVRDGGDVSDDRFHDAASMKTYGISQLAPEPALTIEVTQDGNDEPTFMETTRLENRQDGYVTNVEVASYQYYPLDSGTPTTITLNNTAKTILNYQRNQAKKLTESFAQQQAVINQLKSDYAKIGQDYIALSGDNETNQKAIAEMQSKINELQSMGIVVDINEENSDTSIDFFENVYNCDAKSMVIRLSNGGSINMHSGDQIYNGGQANIIAAGFSHYFMGSGSNEGNIFANQLALKNVSTDKLIVLEVGDASLTTNKEALDTEILSFFKKIADSGYTNICIKAVVSWFDSRFSSSDATYLWKVNVDAYTKPVGSDAWKYTNDLKDTGVGASYAYKSIFI